MNNLVTTLAHEFAHQNGVANEDTARIIGNDAEAAYYKDKGAKCGGL